MTKVVQAITIVFPEFDPASFSTDLQMGEIPGWDSMNSVNLQMQLQTLFGVSCEQLVLSDETTVGEIVTYLKSKKVALSAA